MNNLNPNPANSFTYRCPQSLRPVMADKEAMVRVVRGPVGSGKTTLMIMELVRMAQEQKPGPDGIRRSRMAIVRNTFAQLKSTCLVSIKQVLRPIIKFKISEHTIYIEGAGIYSEWILLPLDTEENIQRLLSLELTAVWASEFRELSVDLLLSAFSRTGRYPAKSFGGCTRYGMLMETNSFSEDSPWYTKLHEELPPNWLYVQQPGARDPGADWLQYLPDGYYDDMVDSASPEWVAQYVDNKITPSLSGQAVFRRSFVTERHVARSRITPVQGYPLILGLDVARNPACAIGQLDARGRLMVLKELIESNMGVEKFVKDYVLPELYRERYAGLSSYVCFDPAGMARSQIGERSTYDMLVGLGLEAVPAMTNAIDPRLAAVERYLNENRGDTAALQIDPEECPMLILAMQSRYRFRKKKDGELEAKPDKTHPWSDIADATQYLCLGTSERLRGRVMARRRARYSKPAAAASAAGWT